jgi:hypothetical protein
MLEIQSMPLREHFLKKAIGRVPVELRHFSNNGKNKASNPDFKETLSKAVSKLNDKSSSEDYTIAAENLFSIFNPRLEPQLKFELICQIYKILIKARVADRTNSNQQKIMEYHQRLLNQISEITKIRFEFPQFDELKNNLNIDLKQIIDEYKLGFRTNIHYNFRDSFTLFIKKSSLRYRHRENELDFLLDVHNFCDAHNSNMEQDAKDDFKLNAAILVLTRIRQDEDNIFKSTLSRLIEMQINDEKRIAEGVPSNFATFCEQNGITIPELLRDFFENRMIVDTTANAGTRLS